MKNIKVSFSRTAEGFINSGFVHISSSVDEMLVLKFYYSETEGLCINLWGKLSNQNVRLPMNFLLD